MSRLFLRLMVTAVATLACFASQAQLFRAYVASDGNDANPCTLVQPCRLLPAALAAVANGGEIWMLDSANYNTGTVVIGKSVTILAIPGAVGSLVTLNGPAIDVTASLLEIALRNLVITHFAGAAAAHGIVMSGNSALTIESSLIAGILNFGVNLSNGRVRIVNSTLRNIGGAAISVGDGSMVHLNASRILRSGSGVTALASVGGSALAYVSDSLIADCGSAIAAVSFNASSVANVVVTRSVIQSNSTGIEAQQIAGAATVSLDGNSITGNFAGYAKDGASVIRSFGNNHFDLNGPNTGTLSVGALQ